MGKIIDCLFIGYNEVSMRESRILLRTTGFKKDSLDYREMDKHFIKYNNKEYTSDELLHSLYYGDNSTKAEEDRIQLTKMISATIIYLGSYIAKKGFEIEYVNLFRAQKEELAQILRENEVLTIAIPTTFYFNPHPIKEIIDFVKKYNKTAKIIIGGPFIFSLLKTIPPEDLQEHLKYYAADFYIYSDAGEAALAGIVKSVKNHQGYDDVDNIFYWDGKEFQFTRSIRENNSFEDDIIDWSVFEGKIGGTVFMRTGKSCPFSCSFCSHTLFAGPYEPASASFIEDRLTAIDKIGTVNRVWFVDDTFNVPVRRFKELLRAMVKNKYKFTWCSCLRCQYVDEETAELMKKSGCELVFLGIESGNQGILDNMNKKVKIEAYYRGVELLNKYNINSVASFIIGYPGETHETFLDTKRFIEEAKPTFYRAGIWRCLPLSAINSIESREKFKIEGHLFDWSHATMDSRTAYDLLDDLYISAKNSVRLIPADLSGEYINYLADLGFSGDQIKKIYTLYGEALNGKLKDPESKGITPELMEALRVACSKK